MKKDKKWVLDKLNKIEPFEFGDGYRLGFETGIKRAKTIVEKLDEPEKVVVPKFVAEWYEGEKKDLEYGIFSLMNSVNKKHRGNHSQIERWANRGTPNKAVETLIKMKLFGYEIEKEKLYYVLDKQGKTLLVLMGGEVRISGGYVLSESTATKDIYQLTEKQIKDYDERFLEFAVEVQE